MARQKILKLDDLIPAKDDISFKVIFVNIPGPSAWLLHFAAAPPIRLTLAALSTQALALVRTAVGD